MSAPLSVEGGRITAAVSEQEQLGTTAKSLPAVANQPQEPEPSRDTLGRMGAHFSPDRRYRYVLWREWESWSNMRTLVVIGLNPSTADETVDDPTIRRCVAFAKREQCGRLVMLNLFALRATDPRVMKADAEPIGPENDAVIRHWTHSTCGDDPLVVAAWGVHGAHRDRAMTVKLLTPRMYCFGVTKDGHPRHPLYLRNDTALVAYPMRPERASSLISERSERLRGLSQDVAVQALTPSSCDPAVTPERTDA